MRVSSVAVACLLTGGPDHTILIGGKPYRFEMSRFGPMPLNKRGTERVFGPHHQFWTAVTCWGKQGSKIDDDGNCIWLEPYGPRQITGSYYESRDECGTILYLERIVGNQYRVLTDNPLHEGA